MSHENIPAGDTNDGEINAFPLDDNYWSNRYDSGTAVWDLGEVSPPLKNYIDQLPDKDLRILIPGCGNTHEADYLLKLGFTNITVIDIAPTLVSQLKEKYKNDQHIKIILGDFFEHEGEYDMVLEQTFFCAIDPSLRKKYVAKMPGLLAPDGKLVGVLFNRRFEEQGPPFGGSREEYAPMFEKDFVFKTFEPCYNSFSKRKDSELFINLVKK
ncbi:MAG: methyltransferase domain-containing protein [Ferruginibacter sp.]